MRAARFLLTASLVLGACATTACSGSDDGAATDDSSEINEGRGVLERPLDPPMTPPTTELIGAKMDEVYEKALGKLTPGSGKKQSDGCTKTEVEDPDTNEVVLERVECKSSDVIRIFDSDGSTKSEHYDLNKDGKVDRYTGEEGAVVQYADSNFDGKVDSIIERVDKVKDFSLKGYDEQGYPKSAFLFRVREDQNKDGKLDHEKLTARGTLRPATESEE